MKKIFLVTIILFQFIYTKSQTKDIVCYNEKNKVEWLDFKELTDAIDSLKQYNFNTSIQMKTIKVNVWTGVTTFEAYGIYYLSNSWVLKAFKSEYLLDYFQLQYNISNSVAKHLEKDINAKRINGGNKHKMNKIFNEYVNRLNQILQKMDIETDNGKTIEIVNNWKTKLSNDTLEN